MTENAWHRRHAIQMVCALPEDQEDALLVLRAAERLVRGFLMGPEENGSAARAEPSGTVVPLRTGC
ncbi:MULTISPECIES: hypothetical protein [unclassified Bradyrhizobium]|uniref:hypothetical protein n=1 Tax=unclassified Bradyrhizobium TaxID=2631580 RepID=UPI001FF9978E|nr:MULTISPECIES: hypothetical protein [unclassified Bradyrhizobium]MCK1533163.1 hypothetical protein [Bradyrhizobium sp. 176]